jgi:capsular polysaccharide export protein
MSLKVATTFSPWLAALADARVMLGVDDVVLDASLPRTRHDACVVAAGTEDERARAVRRARTRGLRVVHAAAGLFRLAEDASGIVPSLALDDLGTPFTDASSLDARLRTGTPEPLRRQAEACIARIREGVVSVYNDAPVRDLGVPVRGTTRVLVFACAEVLPTLVATALDAHPDAEIVACEANGAPCVLARHARVRFVTGRAHPASLFAHVERVYVVDALVGFEALIRGIAVSCLGAPFYAGRGLTQDLGPTPPRTRADITDLFAQTCLVGVRHVDPETGVASDFSNTYAFLARQRACALVDGGPLRCVGFSPWKQTFIPAFLGAPQNDVRFGLGMRGSRTDALVLWGVRNADHAKALGPGARVMRMEDGFLRSVGLGSDSHVPASLVVDTRGIYFDPTRPSDLEHMLATEDFTAEEITRAAALRQRIVVLEISKYNVAARAVLTLPPSAAGKEVALIIGQVDDDASIKLGTRDVAGNLALLRAVRAACPDAFLVYKPHPDVTSGNRAGNVPKAVTDTLVDLVVTDMSVAACLRVATQVHTMTSLVGFEALLRGLPVHVYGLPFYAGWGLTVDRHAHARRFRNRSLDELVAAALLRYPRYIHPRTGCMTTPESIVDYLVGARTRASASPLEHNFFVRYGRMVLAILGSRRRG